MAYITLDDVQNLLGDAFTVPSSWTSGSSPNRRIDAAIATAKEAIDAFTGNTFESTARTLVLNGDGSDLLTTLSISKWPIQSVAQIKVRTNYDDDFDTHGTLIAANAYTISDSLRSILRLDGDVWPQGVRNIRLRATFGRATVPGQIKEAAVLLVREKIQPGYGVDYIQMHSERFSDGYSYTLAGGVSMNKCYSRTTGVQAADVRLAPYILNIPGMRS